MQHTALVEGCHKMSVGDGQGFVVGVLLDESGLDGLPIGVGTDVIDLKNETSASFLQLGHFLWGQEVTFL